MTNRNLHTDIIEAFGSEQPTHIKMGDTFGTALRPLGENVTVPYETARPLLEQCPHRNDLDFFDFPALVVWTETRLLVTTQVGDTEFTRFQIYPRNPSI